MHARWGIGAAPAHVYRDSVPYQERMANTISRMNASLRLAHEADDAANILDTDLYSTFSDDDEEGTEVVGAETMRNHLKELRKSHPQVQCALAVLNVPTASLASLDTSTSRSGKISLPLSLIHI